MKMTALTFVAATAVMLAGCEYPNGEPNNTANGALIGGGAGAVTGAAIGGSHHGGEDALLGAAAGAVVGGIIGNSMDRQQRERLQAQAPQTYARVEQGQPLGVADVRALAQAGVSDDVIISQIQSTHTVYHLTASDIIDLHNAGVSSRVIDFMINTANSSATSTATVADPPPPATTVVVAAPPPPPTEIYVAAPGPGYIWISGEWIWNGRWVWAAGHWAYPPYPAAIWVRGYWYHGQRGWYHDPGHWRR